MKYIVNIDGENRDTTADELKKWPMPSNSYVWYNNEWVTQKRFLELDAFSESPPKSNNDGLIAVASALAILLVLATVMFAVTRGSSLPVRSAAANQPTRSSWTGEPYMWEWWEEIPYTSRVKFCRNYLQDPEAATTAWTEGNVDSGLRIIEWLDWFCPQWTP